MPNSPKLILVVEDDDMLRNIIISQLVPRYQVVAAGDGEEALSLIMQQPPDMIILDLLLPKLDGFGVLANLRGLPDPSVAATPVMVVSNLSDEASRARASRYGVIAYFTKVDITLGSLVNGIKRVLEPDENL